jgi:hypothetical protein
VEGSRVLSPGTGRALMCHAGGSRFSRVKRQAVSERDRQKDNRRCARGCRSGRRSSARQSIPLPVVASPKPQSRSTLVCGNVKYRSTADIAPYVDRINGHSDSIMREQPEQQRRRCRGNPWSTAKEKMVPLRVGAWPNMPIRCAPIFGETAVSLMNFLLCYSATHLPCSAGAGAQITQQNGKWPDG